MSKLIESVQILRDKNGRPIFAVLPLAEYRALVRGKAKAEKTIPSDVLNLAKENDWSASRAWREYFLLTRVDLSQRLGITKGAYAQLEAKKTIRKSSRERIAKAFGISREQLEF